MDQIHVIMGESVMKMVIVFVLIIIMELFVIFRYLLQKPLFCGKLIVPFNDNALRHLFYNVTI